MSDDREINDLLFGLAAVRRGDVAPAELVGAWGDRASEPGKGLADILVRRGAIDASVRAAIEAEAASARESTPTLVSPTLTHVGPTPEGHVLLHTMDALEGSKDRYTLSRLHSKGGLGQVWVARDTSLGRDVAFKEIRPERAENPAVWARFLREARITGGLEHPGIVPIYELSRRPDTGRPFYTMRFVRGRTMTEAIAAYHAKRDAGTAGPLDLQSLLTALVGVANAVAYAHAKGVIHRDLKGDNVILGDYGEVILLDWGLAKAIQDKDDATPGEAAPSEASGTVDGQVLGTPAYMAPEQAAGRNDEIGPLSDVYGLGGILYEILTARPPVTGGDTEDVLRRAAHEPRVRPRALRPDTPPALEAICMKALEARPADRYPSASALAEDVRRFIADEPVSAWREPLVRRAGRWARRHKPLVTAAAALVLAAVVTLSVGTLLLGRKNAEIERQRAQAEENFTLAKGAVDRYLTRVADSRELKAKGLEGLRTQLFGSAREFYETFVKQRSGDAAARSDLGAAYVKLGNISRQTGDTKQAEASFGRAIELYDALTRTEPGELRHRKDLLLTVGNLGLLQSETGRPKDAEASYKRAIAIFEGLPAAMTPDADALADVANVYDNLGTLYNATRRTDESEAVCKKGLAVRRRLATDHPDVEAYRSGVLQSEANLAALYAVTGREAEAEPYLADAAAIGETLMAAHPDDPEYAKNLAATLNNLGGVYTLTGRMADAHTAHERALTLRETLAAEHPAVLEYQMYLAGSYVNVGELDVRDGRSDAALDALGKAERTLSGILEKEPKHEIARFYIAYTLSWRARALAALGRGDEAMRMWERATSFNDRGFPTIPAGFAVALARRGDLAKALAQAQAVEKVPQLPGEVLYDLAATWSLASAREAGQREAYAAHAVLILGKAGALGFFKTPGIPEQIRKDRDFDPIRGRPDYRKIVGG